MFSCASILLQVSVGQVIETCLSVLAVFWAIAAGRAAFASEKAVRGTTAHNALRWLQAALIANVVLVSLRLFLPTRQAAMSYLGYAAAVLLLTPLIAILGARKPGHRAWPWFVVVPLWLVLQWPSLSQLAAGGMATPLEVPTPTMVGFMLVLVMGAGNYFGTRHTSTALLGGGGVLLAVLPYAEWTAKTTYPWYGLLGLNLTAVAAWRFTSVVSRQQEWQRLTPAEQWIQFRDLYGIVWSKRVMDRVNQLAGREKLMVTLTLDGFEHHDSEDPSVTAHTARVGQLLAWVLKRFLEESLLQHNLPPRRSDGTDPGTPSNESRG